VHYYGDDMTSIIKFSKKAYFHLEKGV
jgi:hypothetical protein